MDVEGVQ